ncbi:hypothetical protein [Bacillus sp. NPDC094106]|uniref:hypothetical protein n=1 Tax=Bacillus sp. NPDC094106 TaxID=3363949 RepID=UPI00382A08C4
MNKDVFFADQYVTSFLHDFNQPLMDLPVEIREQHVLEIKSDLYEQALEKANEGIALALIPQQVVQEFLPPKQLARKITAEYADITLAGQHSTNTFIRYYTGLSIGAFGALSVPIILGFINVSACLPFLLAFVASNLWFIFRKNYWNSNLLSYFKRIISFGISMFIAIPFAFFAIRIMMTKQIDMFSLYYLIGYLICSAIYIFLLQQQYKKNIHHQSISDFSIY